MDIRHTDKDGNPWAFSIDCTPYQAELLKRALLSVRNIGGREQLTLKYYEDHDANEAFCRGIEQAVLTALAKAFPMKHDEPQAPQPTATPQPELFDTDEHAPRYYWENF